MLRYIIKRLLGAIPTLFIIITISFFLMRLAPGGPFSRERSLPPEIEANMIKAYHLDDRWMQLCGISEICWGDFGPSIGKVSQRLIGGRFPSPDAMALPYCWRLPSATAGIIRLRQNSRMTIDHGFAMVGDTSFVVAPMLTLFIGSRLAAGRQLGQRPAHGASYHRPCAASDRCHRATDAWQHDRGLAQ
jgi:oligopeptide transport system permease protein